MFAPDWFGNSSSVSAPDHVIDAGQWAYTPVKQRATNYSAVTNPYGLLRSPWNSFRAPHVTRYRKTDGGVVERELPGCDVFQACFRSNATSRMNQCMAGATRRRAPHDRRRAHRPRSLLLEPPCRARVQPVLLRDEEPVALGLVRTPAYCSMDTPEADCRTFCPAALWQGRNKTGLDLLVESRQMHFIDQWSSKIYYDGARQTYALRGYTPEKEARTFDRLLAALCTAGHVGEMFSSAAPYDPAFWPIHPTTERLLHYRRHLANAEPAAHALGTSWGYAHAFDQTATDTGMYCDWDGVGDDDDGGGDGAWRMPSCVRRRALVP